MAQDTKITVIEKPEEISFDQIHEVLWAANQRNRDDGFYLSTASMPGEKLKERIGDDGKCFVALAATAEEDPEIVGTISVRFFNSRRWYAKGRIADYMLAGVIPSWQGKHINSMLAEKVFEAAREAGCKVIELDTAVTNKHAIAVYKHQGFRLVSFKANPGGDHYSVIMARWLDKCPYSQARCRLRYMLKKCMITLRYKPDKKKRFGI